MIRKVLLFAVVLGVCAPVYSADDGPRLDGREMRPGTVLQVADDGHSLVEADIETLYLESKKIRVDVGGERLEVAKILSEPDGDEYRKWFSSIRSISLNAENYVDRDHTRRSLDKLCSSFSVGALLGSLRAAILKSFPQQFLHQMGIKYVDCRSIAKILTTNIRRVYDNVSGIVERYGIDAVAQLEVDSEYRIKNLDSLLFRFESGRLISSPLTRANLSLEKGVLLCRSDSNLAPLVLLPLSEEAMLFLPPGSSEPQPLTSREILQRALSLLHPDQLHGRIVPPEPFPIPRPL